MDLQVAEGQIAVLLGGNGAGKTTMLRAISNLLAIEGGALSRGSIEFNGERVDGLRADRMVARGLVHVMEGRHCFAHLTVHENLLAGAHTRADRGEVDATLERIYGYFPRLRECRSSRAALVSGGEQQMCAIGRGLMARPSFVLLDEPSMGLAPRVVAEVFDIVSRLNQQEGMTFLIAEQNAAVALKHAHACFVVEDGRVILQGSGDEFAADPRIQQAYLGGRSGNGFNYLEAARARGLGPLGAH